jgi:hypothetical protein
MTSWINSCRTAVCYAFIWSCSNVGSWFLACIKENSIILKGKKQESSKDDENEK